MGLNIYSNSIKPLIFVLALMAGAMNGCAQNDQTHKQTPNQLTSNFADSIRQIQEVTVMGKRPLATTQSLNGKELQALSSTSIADALKYFAGVQIKDMGGLGGLKTINVRSLGAQHVGVYIDGIRITNAQNGTVDLGKYSLSTLESVQLYNANKLDECQSASEYASGATVYLRTRRPQTDSISAQLRLASFHTYSGKLNAQFAKKGWSGFIDGEYMNYKRIIPETFERIAYINTETFLQAAERALIVTEDKLGGSSSKTFIKLEFEDNLLKVSSASTGGSVYEELPVSMTGGDLVIGFNCRFLVDALKVAEGNETVCFKMNGPLMGICIEAAEGGEEEKKDPVKFTLFVMPLRMNGR